MKTYKIDLNAIPVQGAKALIEQGKRFAEMAKTAVDAAAISYWSDYFKQYGDFWVHVKGLQKLGSEKTAGQTMYDCAIALVLSPQIEIAPSAFEHAMKFCIHALKVDGVASFNADHIYSEVQDPLGENAALCGYAHLGVAFSEEPKDAFVAELKSQLSASLSECGFPPMSVEIQGFAPRREPQESIIAAATRGDSLAKLTAQFGRGPATLAQKCAKLAREANSAGASMIGTPVAHKMAQIAIEKIHADEEAKEMRYEGNAEDGVGVIGTSPHGFVAQIQYRPTELPQAFGWEIRNAQGEVMKFGKADTEENAKQMVAAELPKLMTKDEKAQEKEAVEARIAISKAVKSPVARMETIAKVGSAQEVKAETLSGQTHWVALDGGRVVQAVCSL